MSRGLPHAPGQVVDRQAKKYRAGAGKRRGPEQRPLRPEYGHHDDTGEAAIKGQAAQNVEQSMTARPIAAPVVDADSVTFHSPAKPADLPRPERESVRPHTPNKPALVNDLDLRAQLHNEGRLAAGPGEPAPAAQLVARDGPLCGTCQHEEQENKEDDGPDDQRPVGPTQPKGKLKIEQAGDASNEANLCQTSSPRALIESDWPVRGASRVHHVTLPFAVQVASPHMSEASIGLIAP